jgi:hypothetical protein
VALPDRIFVIVIQAQEGRDPDRMRLLNRSETDGIRITPVFSSMRGATTFLSQGQELGYTVDLDYIFPVDGGQFADDFPEYRAELDPSPASFFVDAPSP